MKSWKRTECPLPIAKGGGSSGSNPALLSGRIRSVSSDGIEIGSGRVAMDSGGKEGASGSPFPSPINGEDRLSSTSSQIYILYSWCSPRFQRLYFHRIPRTFPLSPFPISGGSCGNKSEEPEDFTRHGNTHGSLVYRTEIEIFRFLSGQ